LNALTLTATGGLDRLALQDVPPPERIHADDVRVRVHAAALNRLDLWVAGGLPGLPSRFPHIMGSDGAGTIESVGPAVRGLASGDPVLINPGAACGQCDYCLAGDQPLCPDFGILGEHRPGTLAEYVVVPARSLVRKPEAMSWHEAAALPLTTLTAWRMLITRAALRPGETVLIWGIGGGVSLAALRIAREAGARVIVTSSSDAKLARALELGADHGLNHARVEVSREVKALTGRRGADVVVDSVGQQTWEQSLRSLARKGRLVTCGGTSGHQLTIDVRKLFWYQWTIMGSTMGSESEFRAIVELAGRGRLRPLVDRVFPLARAHEGFTRLAAGEQMGKIVIEVGP
jgi:NADPH:quinone reductase-like Zn-dependent oxidoreductase